MKQQRRFLFVALAAAIAGCPFAPGPSAWADAIPPDQLFLPPASLVEGVLPRKAIAGDGTTSPWTLTWSTDDILAIDPGRVDITLQNLRILPILVPNPSPDSEEGEYTDAELAAITPLNYADFFFYSPGLDINDPAAGYAADLTGNVLTAWLRGQGPWIFRVETTSRPFPGGPLESVEYHWFNMIVDEFAILSGSAPIPAHVRRIFDPGADGDGGVAANSAMHLVAEDADDNGYLDNCFETLECDRKDPDRVDSIDDLVQKVCAAGEPVELHLYAHGNGPDGSAATGLIKIGNEWVCCGNGCTIKPAELGEKLRGKVKSITLHSCHVGSDLKFLKDLANGARTSVTGWKEAVTAAGKWIVWPGIVLRDGFFNLDAGGKKGLVAPDPCGGGCAGDLDFDNVVNGADLGLLLGSWGPGECGDFNGDGTVDGADLGILLSAWGTCTFTPPPFCGPEAGPCCDANGSPGCGDPFCCELVCELDPFCCEVEWDAICASGAGGIFNCGCPQLPVCGGSSTSCCDLGEGPGCGNAECCSLICESDLFCCQVTWDQLCADAAGSACSEFGVICGEFAIFTVQPQQFQSGQLINIIGTGFPENPDSLRIVISQGPPDGGVAAGPGAGVVLRAVSSTPGLIVARVGAVPPGFGLGTLTAQVGTGVITAPPSLPPVVMPIGPGILFWSASTSLIATAPIPVIPMPFTPPPCMDFFGGFVTGSLEVTLSGPGVPLPAGTMLEVTVDAALASGTLQFTQQLPLSTTMPLTTSALASAICSSIQSVFFAQTGLFFPCTALVVGPGTITVILDPPFGDSFDPAQFNTFSVRVCGP